MYFSNSKILNCSFTNNSLLNKINKSSATEQVSDYLYGKLIHSVDSFFDNCIFEDNFNYINTLRNGYDGIELCFNVLYGSFNLSNTVFKNNFISINNTTTMYNGPFTIKPLGLCVHTLENSTINNCTFYNNYLKLNDTYITLGAAIFSEAEYIKISNCTFENNYGESGGAIYLRNQLVKNKTYDEYTDSWIENPYNLTCFADIDNCTFINNTGIYGGAIYESNCGTTITNSKFTNNSGSYGGAINTNSDNVYITSSKFENNSGLFGGAIYYNGSDGIISYSTFENNSASSDGGAIYCNGSDCSISSSVLGNNNANKDSGVFFASSDNIVKDCILINSNVNPVLYSERYVVTANYNWWGNTLANFTTKPNVPTRIEVKNWLFLNITADNDTIKMGDISTINCDLSYLATANGNPTKYYAFALPDINLTIETVNGIADPITLIEGICQINFIPTNIPEGSITIKYENIEYTINYLIEKGYVELTSSDNVIYNGYLSIFASDNASGNVNVKIDNNNYYGEMIDGELILIIDNLSINNYSAVISFESDLYEPCTLAKKINIMSSISAMDLTKNINDDSNFVATFYDLDGSILKNTKITYLLNGNLKTEETDDNGVISLNINLNPGTYDITLLNPVNDESKVNKITITADSGSGNGTGPSSGNSTNSSSGNGTGPSSGNSTNSSSGNSTAPTVSKISTQLIVPKVTATYNVNKYVVVTLKDSKGNILVNKKVTVKVGSISKTLTTNAKGQVSVLVSSLLPKTYTASITFAGDNNYVKSSVSAIVTVKKATPKLTAKAKTFKVKVKTKKYTITLKNNKSKVMKNTKVTLKVKGKTFTAKTNSKGVATFKITNLKKKGKFTAVVTYAGSKYYTKVTKKPKITIK